MGNSTKRKFKLVIIEWMDAESVDAWTDISGVDKSITPIESAGWLLHEDEDSYILALNHDINNEKCSCIMKIPRGMVVSKKIVKS